MFTQGIYPIGDGLLDIDEARLKGLLVQDDINEIYDVEQTPFARGKFAAVRRAIHKQSGVHFAAKFLKRRRRAQSSDKEIKHEIAVLMLCDGADNIVKLNAVHESRSDTALLLDLATGGELQTFLDNEECLSEVQARACMREVLKALQFLHNRSIAHLDLKPQNILLAGERIEDGLKLCDFGISRVVAEGTNVREIVGTPDYVAPEVLQYEPLSLLTDIWSVGVLTYVLLSGFSPFGGDTKQETFLNISQCALTFPDKLFGGVSAPAIDFMRRALRIKPGDRMSAAGCLEHVWLKNECSIDRQIFNNISKAASAGDEIEEDDDDGDQDESFADEEEEEEEEDEDDEELDDFCNSDNNITSFNGHKMDSSDIEHHSQAMETTKPNLSNGNIKMNGSSCSSYNLASNSEKVKSLLTAKGQPAIAIYSASNGNTKKATAIISVPAIRATTITLAMPTAGTTHHQPSQLLHVAARRHSSDANKENTYLATKKGTTAQLSAANGGASKKPPSLAATAATITAATANHVVANIAASTPGAIDKHTSSTINAVCCIFPDAPTTPKVIRKAPTTDTSPTSVKALVKKFQLEVGGSSCNNSYSGDGSRASSPAPPATATTTTLLASATVAATATSVAHLNESPLQNQEPQHIIGNNVRNANASHRRASTASSTINGSRGNDTKTTNNRKSTGNASSLLPTEVPAATVHLQKSAALSSPLKKSSNSAAASPSPSTAATTTTTSSTPACNFKTTCVFCLTCSSNNSNGTSNSNNIASSSSTVCGCGHATTAASNGSSTAAAAILLSSHKQLQHHHHHAVHHVQKSAATNLSLDQGIIC